MAMAQFRLPECSLTQSAHFVRQALTAFAMQNPCSRIDCSFETGLAGWGVRIRTYISESKFNQILSPGGRTGTCASRIASARAALLKKSQTLTMSGGPDSLAVEAVRCEPVSALISLLYGNLQGIFAICREFGH